MQCSAGKKFVVTRHGEGDSLSVTRLGMVMMRKQGVKRSWVVASGENFKEERRDIFEFKWFKVGVLYVFKPAFNFLVPNPRNCVCQILCSLPLLCLLDLACRYARWRYGMQNAPGNLDGPTTS